MNRQLVLASMAGTIASKLAALLRLTDRVLDENDPHARHSFEHSVVLETDDIIRVAKETASFVLNKPTDWTEQESEFGRSFHTALRKYDDTRCGTELYRMWADEQAPRMKHRLVQLLLARVIPLGGYKAAATGKNLFPSDREWSWFLGGFAPNHEILTNEESLFLALLEGWGRESATPLIKQVFADAVQWDEES